MKMTIAARSAATTAATSQSFSDPNAGTTDSTTAVGLREGTGLGIEVAVGSLAAVGVGVAV
jgi:hypothetical protein